MKKFKLIIYFLFFNNYYLFLMDRLEKDIVSSSVDESNINNVLDVLKIIDTVNIKEPVNNENQSIVVPLETNIVQSEANESVSNPVELNVNASKIDNNESLVNHENENQSIVVPLETNIVQSEANESVSNPVELNINPSEIDDNESLVNHESESVVDPSEINRNQSIVNSSQPSSNLYMNPLPQDGVVMRIFIRGNNNRREVDELETNTIASSNKKDEESKVENDDTISNFSWLRDESQVNDLNTINNEIDEIKILEQLTSCKDVEQNIENVSKNFTIVEQTTFEKIDKYRLLNSLDVTNQIQDIYNLFDLLLKEIKDKSFDYIDFFWDPRNKSIISIINESFVENFIRNLKYKDYEKILKCIIMIFKNPEYIDSNFAHLIKGFLIEYKDQWIELFKNLLKNYQYLDTKVIYDEFKKNTPSFVNYLYEDIYLYFAIYFDIFIKNLIDYSEYLIVDEETGKVIDIQMDKMIPKLIEYQLLNNQKSLKDIFIFHKEPLITPCELIENIHIKKYQIIVTHFLYDIYKSKELSEEPPFKSNFFDIYLNNDLKTTMINIFLTNDMYFHIKDIKSNFVKLEDLMKIFYENFLQNTFYQHICLYDNIKSDYTIFDYLKKIKTIKNIPLIKNIIFHVFCYRKYFFRFRFYNFGEIETKDYGPAAYLDYINYHGTAYFIQKDFNNLKKIYEKRILLKEEPITQNDIDNIIQSFKISFHLKDKNERKNIIIILENLLLRLDNYTIYENNFKNLNLQRLINCFLNYTTGKQIYKERYFKKLTELNKPVKDLNNILNYIGSQIIEKTITKTTTQTIQNKIFSIVIKEMQQKYCKYIEQQYTFKFNGDRITTHNDTILFWLNDILKNKIEFINQYLLELKCIEFTNIITAFLESI